MGGSIRGSGSPTRVFLGRGYFEVRQRVMEMIKEIALSPPITARGTFTNGLALGVRCYPRLH